MLYAWDDEKSQCLEDIFQGRNKKQPGFWIAPPKEHVEILVV
jgi:hypothetical protein